jgi:hypothetical protein
MYLSRHQRYNTIEKNYRPKKISEWFQGPHINRTSGRNIIENKNEKFPQNGKNVFPIKNKN